MSNYVDFSVKYANCMNSKERKDLIFEEAQGIKQKYHLSDAIKVSIVKHYLYNYRSKLGNVAKTIKFVDTILIYSGFSEEERNKFLLDNFRMYLADYTDFRIRLAIFNKCNLFEEALFVKNRFLTKYSSTDELSCSLLYAIAARKNFNLSFDEIEYLSKSNINKVELVNKYSLTNEIIQSIDSELIEKIKSLTPRTPNNSVLKK